MKLKDRLKDRRLSVMITQDQYKKLEHLSNGNTISHTLRTLIQKSPSERLTATN